MHTLNCFREKSVCERYSQLFFIRLALLLLIFCLKSNFQKSVWRRGMRGGRWWRFVLIGWRTLINAFTKFSLSPHAWRPTSFGTQCACLLACLHILLLLHHHSISSSIVVLYTYRVLLFCSTQYINTHITLVVLLYSDIMFKVLSHFL